MTKRELGFLALSTVLGITGYMLLDGGFLHDLIVGCLFTAAGALLYHAATEGPR